MKKNVVMVVISTVFAMTGCAAPTVTEEVGSAESRQTAGASSSPPPSDSPPPAPSAPTATSDSGCTATVCAGGATTGRVAGGEKAIEVYGVEATKNTSLDCASATAIAGALVAYELSTGRMVLVAGAGATGPVSLLGGDGTTRDGAGSVAIGALASWDPNTYTLNLGGALVGYYTIDVGSSMPADAAAATAAFDAAFGEAARYGATLSKLRSIPWFGGSKAIAYYNTVETTVTASNGATYPATVAVGIINDWGKIKAVQFSGLGSSRSYIK